MLTKCWALEYAKDGIRVNYICPVVVDAGMPRPFLKDAASSEMMNAGMPLGRIGKPEDIAGAVLYFVSDEASWVTGAYLQSMGESQQNNPHGFNIAWCVHVLMDTKKKKAKLIIMLGVIWIIVTLPLPWIVNNPQVSESQMNIILGIVGIMSIPFIVLGVVWTLKPELTT